jgi:hypothetical protein
MAQRSSRLACWLERGAVGLTAASRPLRAACLLWSFSTARAHADAFAVAATSLGCLLLSFAANCGSAGRSVRTLMAPAWGRVIAPLVEIGSAPNTSRRVTCGQAEHLKICRSIGGAQRMASPTITSIRRMSPPHARHRMTLTPSPGISSFTPHTLPRNRGGLSAGHLVGLLPPGSSRAQGGRYARALGTTSSYPRIKQSRRVFSDFFEMG